MKKVNNKNTKFRIISRWFLVAIMLSLFVISIILLCWFEKKYNLVWSPYNQDLPFGQQTINWDITKWKLGSFCMVFSMTASAITLPFIIYWSIKNTKNEVK